MAFADELRKTENRTGLAETAQFEKELEEICAAIHGACIRKADKHSVNGYVLRRYDDEYCVYGFEWKDTLHNDNTVALRQPLKYREKTKHYLNIALSRYYGDGRAGYEPIAEQQIECDRYISRLGDMLVNDGLSVQKLSSCAVVDEYETIEYQGFFQTKEYLKKHTSDTVVGYVIECAITW